MLTGIVLVILMFLGPSFAQGSLAAPGSIRGEVFTLGTTGELAVLPGVLVVVHGPITNGTESDALGAFAVDGPPLGTYPIEANAPDLYTALAGEAGAGTSSTLPVQMNIAAVDITTAPQLTRLRAIDFASSRKMPHHA
jgi:hypothetical protein